jgi:kynurenine 3-monooxygenase
MKTENKDVALIGSGLAGPLLAMELVKRGFSVRMFERRPDMRQVHIAAGRSINLAVSTRGIHALREAGVWQQLEKIVVPMKGRMMHSVAGELTFQRYGKDDTEVINSVSRADLNVALMDAAEEHGVKIQFGQRCLGYDLEGGAIRLRDEVTGRESRIESKVVIGTDGSASAIRLELMKRLPRFNFSQQYLDYGYKELTIPARHDGKHVLETNALHIWPRGTYMLIALPNMDGTFACILFLPFEGNGSFAELDSREKVKAFFETNFPDVVPLMPNLLDNYFENPTGAMVTIKCFPWHHGNNALLLGDAAHAIVPFFGQGLNCAFEDCTVLLELIDRYGADWARVFEEFENARKVNTDAIADLAIENFVEMRDKVADPRFLFRKKTELALEAKFPGLFVPKYAMVTFHRLPYSVALSRGRLQDRMLGELCEHVYKIEDLDWKWAELMIRRELTPLGEL